VSRARLAREVVSARTQLERTYGVPVDFLAYPYGHVNARVAGVVADAGYLGATVTGGGFATPTGDPRRLPRIIVSPRMTPAQLVARLGG
jgi:peptidoglycan/xylan/chitin deacetylase (PgdA/CDA1 family)